MKVSCSADGATYDHEVYGADPNCQGAGDAAKRLQSELDAAEMARKGREMAHAKKEKALDAQLRGAEKRAAGTPRSPPAGRLDHLARRPANAPGAPKADIPPPRARTQ